MTGPTDIRYRARCFHCDAVLGDAYLGLPLYKRFCFDCLKPKTTAYSKDTGVPASYPLPHEGTENSDSPV